MQDRRRDFSPEISFFDPAFKHAEDYELWIRAAAKLKFGNIPKVLLSYRNHEDQVSYKHNNTQLDLMFKCQLIQFENIGINISSDESTLHYSILKLDYIFESAYLEKVLNWFKKISNSNLISNYFDQKALDITLYKKWISISGHLLKNNCKAGKIIYSNHFNVSQSVYLNAISFYFLKSFMILKFVTKIK